jgi:hypothetical protein
LKKRLELPTLAERVLKTKRRYHKQVSCNDPGGGNRSDVRWSLILQPIVDQQEPLGVVGLLADINDAEQMIEIGDSLHNVAQSLASEISNEDRLEELLLICGIVENANDFIGTTDEQGNLMFLKAKREKYRKLSVKVFVRLF